MNLPISPIDLTIILIYMGVVLALGLWLSRGQKSTEDYFLGGRSLPWWAVLLSTVATETSTVTFLSIPGVAYAAGGDLRFLQITFGYIAGRMLTAVVLLPLYFQGRPFTSYEVLQHRFGAVTRRVCAAIFLVTRNLSDGLRLYLTALVLQTALNLDLPTCVIGLGAVTIAYTFMGGVRSVIWNDCVQLVIYLLGAAAAFYVIVTSLPEGWNQFLQFARDNQKLQVLDWEFALKGPTINFWSGLIGGAFLTAATHGTDQLMVQRFLATSSLRAARGALVLSGVVVCLQFALFLLIGVGLAAFYQAFPSPHVTSATGNDRVFADFIVYHLGTGLVGLTLAAVFAAAMSTLSSSLNSSATALVNDLWLPLSGGVMSEASQLRLGKAATIGFGLLQAGIALVSYAQGAQESVVNNVLKIAAFATGPMLGLYLLGIFTKQVGQQAALWGMALGVGALSAVALLTEVYWPWYAVIGALATIFFGLACHVLFAGSNNQS